MSRRPPSPTAPPRADPPGRGEPPPALGRPRGCGRSSSGPCPGLAPGMRSPLLFRALPSSRPGPGDAVAASLHGPRVCCGPVPAVSRPLRLPSAGDRRTPSSLVLQEGRWPPPPLPGACGCPACPPLGPRGASASSARPSGWLLPPVPGACGWLPRHTLARPPRAAVAPSTRPPQAAAAPLCPALSLRLGPLPAGGRRPPGVAAPRGGQRPVQAVSRAVRFPGRPVAPVGRGPRSVRVRGRRPRRMPVPAPPGVFRKTSHRLTIGP